MNFIKAQKKYLHIFTGTGATPSSQGITGRDDEFYFNSTDSKLWYFDGTSFQVIQLGATELSALSDVSLTTLTNGQVLQWNGTAWVNATPSVDASNVNNAKNITSTNTMNITGGTGATLKDVILEVKTGGIKTNELADDAVTNAKIANDAVNTTEIANNAVTTSKIAPSGNLDEFLMTDGAGATNWKDKTYVKSVLGVSEVFNFKGSVANITNLPTAGNTNGDVYNVVNSNHTDGFEENFNVVYVGSGGDVSGEWDLLGGTVDLSGYYTKTDANNKFVDSVNTNNILYGTNNSGTDTTYVIGTNASEIPQRDGSGQITVPATPAANTDAASKQYVNNQVAATKTEKLCIDLRDNTYLSMIAVENCKLEWTSTTTNGDEVTSTSSTMTLTVNTNAYTEGTTINAGDEIEFTATAASVWSYDYTTM